MSFPVSEATVAQIHAAFASGALSAEQLTAAYLARMESRPAWKAARAE